MTLCELLKMNRETCAQTLQAARGLKKYEEDDRLCIIYKSEDGMDYISHIHYENGFIMDVRKFNLRFDGVRYHHDYDINLRCPPDPIRIIVQGLFVKKDMREHIIAFAFFCDKQARKYAATAARATAAPAAATVTAAYAADATNATNAADAAADTATNAVDAATYYTVATDATDEQYAFLVKILKGTEWEETE